MTVVAESAPLSTVAKIIMGQSPPGDTYNKDGDGLPLLNGPTEFGTTYPACTLFTTDSRRDCEAGDLIFCVRGSTTGRMNWADRKYSLGRGVCGIRGDTEAETRFIRYCIEDQLHALLQLAGGGTFPNLTKDDIEEFEIPWPTNRVRITNILSAYDELAENSQQRIRILEEMARNLYYQWFINFRFPGHQKRYARAASTLGDVPKDWLLPLPDHVDFKEGPGLRNWQYRDAGIPFLNIRTIVDNDIDFTKVQFLDSQEVESKYQHFLLSEYDHVVSSSGTIGRIVTIRADHLPLMLNTSIIRMRPKSKRMGRWLLKHFMLSRYFQNQAKAFAIGAAQANFGPMHLKQMHVIAPDEKTAAEFERLVAPMELAILTLARRIQNLRRTRNLLLPQLLSGQLSLNG